MLSKATMRKLVTMTSKATSSRHSIFPFVVSFVRLRGVCSLVIFLFMGVRDNFVEWVFLKQEQDKKNQLGIM